MILLKQAPDFLELLLCLSETTKVASQNHPLKNTSYFYPIMEGHEHLPSQHVTIHLYLQATRHLFP